TAMVISPDDGKELYRQVEDAASDVAAMVRTHLPDIRRRYQGLACAKKLSFERLSLLILSDVLLDNWQIETVERSFVRAERTLRNGMHYYQSFAARSPPLESFGIYGNAHHQYGDVGVALYGNGRNGTNFQTLSREQLVEYFGMDSSRAANSPKAKLAHELVALWQNP